MEILKGVEQPLKYFLVQNLKVFPVAEGQVICEKGDLADYLYFVSNGHVLIDGRKVTGMFGEIAMVTNLNRTKKVVAGDNCRLAAIGKEALSEVKDKFGHFYRALKDKALSYCDESLEAKRRLVSHLPFCAGASNLVVDELVA